MPTGVYPRKFGNVYTWTELNARLRGLKTPEAVAEFLAELQRENPRLNPRWRARVNSRWRRLETARMVAGETRVVGK